MAYGLLLSFWPIQEPTCLCQNLYLQEIPIPFIALIPNDGRVLPPHPTLQQDLYKLLGINLTQFLHLICDRVETKNTSILLYVMGYQFTSEGRIEVLFSSQYNELKCLKLGLQFPVRVPLSAQHRTMLIQHHYNFKSSIWPLKWRDLPYPFSSS